MDAQAHLNFLKRMIAQLQEQADELESSLKVQFDAAQLALPISEQQNNIVKYPLSAIADEGWIEWKGGYSPVASGVKVDWRSRSGLVHYGWMSDVVSWLGGGVIAYRIAGERT